jgi:cathepsin L
MYRRKMKSIILVLLFVVVASSLPTSDPLQEPNWKAWKSFHGKSYTNQEEEKLRNLIWKSNLKKIVAHNEGKHSYKLAMNHLGDMVCLWYLKCRFFYLQIKEILTFCNAIRGLNIYKL